MKKGSFCFEKSIQQIIVTAALHMGLALRVVNFYTEIKMDPIILDGLKLMGLGMGMVFFFLLIMVVLVNLNAKILEPFKNVFEPKPVTAKPTPSAAKKDLMQDKKLTEVISEAIKAYKKDKEK